MKIAQIVKILEDFAPPQGAAEWDRIGLMVGDVERQCSGVVLALDVTDKVIDEAVEKDANLIVSHHPFIWDALARIDVSRGQGKQIERLIKHDISVYSAHTNLDMAPTGLNVTLAAMLGGGNIRLDDEGAGALFDVDTTLGELASRTADVLGDRTVTFVGDADDRVRTAYLVTGSGGSEYTRASGLADVLITGELRHNRYIEARRDGFRLIEFSHYYSEIIMQDILYGALASTGLNIIRAASDCPFRRLEEV